MQDEKILMEPLVQPQLVKDFFLDVVAWMAKNESKSKATARMLMKPKKNKEDSALNINKVASWLGVSVETMRKENYVARLPAKENDSMIPLLITNQKELEDCARQIRRQVLELHKAGYNGPWAVQVGRSVDNPTYELR